MEILTLTDDEFAFTFESAANTRDTIVVTGDNAKAAIMAAAGSNVNIKNNKTDLGYWDVEANANFFTGGGASDWSRVSDEMRDLVNGNGLQRDDVLKIFEAITSGGSWGNPGSNGLDGVELVGMDNDSFTIGMKNGVRTDYIIFDNVDTLTGADSFGFFADDDPLSI